MSKIQNRLSNFVVEIAKVPYKNGEVLDIRYIKTKIGNVFCTALDVAKRLHGEIGKEQTSGQLSRVISKLGYTIDETLEMAMSKVINTVDILRILAHLLTFYSFWHIC